MGSGGYSVSDRQVRAQASGYYTKPTHEVFTAKHMNEGMNPYGVKIRESRDSSEHPNSLAIIIALDQTGSMGYMPHHLIKDGLPTLMSGIIENGIPDPQVMFCAIGDAHNGEEAPFQISQFESSDALLDHWLEKVYLEGNGGGNGGEDYSFAHYFAAKHTSIDCFEKRGEKGFLFTIGDDKPHSAITGSMFKHYLGEPEGSQKTAIEMIAEAKKMYNVYHIHVGTEEASGRVKSTWRELLGENFIDCPRFEEAPKIIARIIADNARKYSGSFSESITPSKSDSSETPVYDESEML